MEASTHSLRSSYREMLLEHLFIGELLRELWCMSVTDVDVLKPQVDDHGYDVVVICGRTTRHIQLKASHIGASTKSTTLNIRLSEKEGGCLVWIWFDPEALHLDHYLWFGGPPGEGLPDISEFRAAKHTKGDATGQKSRRPNMRTLPKGKLTRVDTMAQLVEHLFGQVGA